MASKDLLWDSFLNNGKKEGFSEEFLDSIFQMLKNNAFIPAGEREHLRATMMQLINKEAGGKS